MSIPVYEKASLSKDQLTDDIMDAAIERAEFGAMDVDVTRNAVYQYLSHSAVWDEELAALEVELRKEKIIGGDDVDLLFFAEVLADEVNDLLRGKESLKYRKSLSPSAVTVAAKACGVSVTTDDLLVMLSELAVCGEESYDLMLLLEDCTITKEQLKQIATVYCDRETCQAWSEGIHKSECTSNGEPEE